MEPFLSELPYHIYDWLIISLKNFCIVIRKWPTFLPSIHLLGISKDAVRNANHVEKICKAYSCSNETTPQVHGLHVLHNWAALHGMGLHCMGPHCMGCTYCIIGLHCMPWVALHGTALHGVALHGAALHGDALHGAALHGGALHGLQCIGCMLFFVCGGGQSH